MKLDSEIAQRIRQRDEGYVALLKFINEPSDDLQERAKQGEVVLAIANGRLEQLYDEKGLTLHALGGIIHRMRHGEAWRYCDGMGEEWRTFSSFCEERLKMSLSKANALERVWSRSLDIGLQPEEIELMGWNAAQYLIRVAKTRREVDYWINEYTTSENRVEFVEKIKAALDQARKEREGSESGDGQSQDVSVEKPTQKRLIVLTPTQDRFFIETLEHAASELNKKLGISISTNECLLLILTDWRSMKSK